MRNTILLLSSIAFFGFASIYQVNRNPQVPAQTKQDSLAAQRKVHMDELRALIAGKEDLPAEEVFTNIQYFKGRPAKTLLAIMNFGYSRGLGVSCEHCHNTNDWGSDEKVQKQIAREMSEMSKKINGELLTSIKGLQSEQPAINCTTCHRGEIIPAQNLSR